MDEKKESKAQQAQQRVLENFVAVKNTLLNECHGAEAVMDALDLLDSAHAAAFYAIRKHSIHGSPPENALQE